MVFFVQVLKFCQDRVSAAENVPYIIEIVAGISTLVLSPPKGQEVVYTTLCSLVVALLTTSPIFATTKIL